MAGRSPRARAPGSLSVGWGEHAACALPPGMHTALLSACRATTPQRSVCLGRSHGMSCMEHGRQDSFRLSPARHR